MGFLNLEVRPGGDFKQKFGDINALFTCSYIFASQFISSKNVLDSGCGTGYGAKYVAEHGARSVIGIDVDSETIRKCQEKYRDVKNLKFMLCNSPVLKFENEFFDVVMSMEVIEHIRDYKRYLAEIYRVVKRGGVVIISTPNKNIFSPGLGKPTITVHVKEFYGKELSLLLAGYFPKVKIYGEHVTNNSYLEKQKQYHISWKYIVVKNLAQSDFIKTVGKYTPYFIRKFISGGLKDSLKIDDILISENNIDKAHLLIAVCYKYNSEGNTPKRSDIS